MYSKRKLKAVEPAVLAEAWYYDRASATSWVGPAERFDGVAWFDANVVDGAVNGSRPGWCRAPPG